MDKDFILKQTKEQISHVIHETTFLNLNIQREKINHFFQFLENLNSLETVQLKKATPKKYRLLKPSLEPIAPETAASMEKEDIKGSSSLESQEIKSPILDKVFTFERKVRGGIIQDLEGGYVIPEKMVRDMGIEHLDKVKITSFRKIEEDERTQYWFDIIEKVNAPVPNRIEYKFCKVEKDFGELLVRSSHEGDIRIDDIPFQIIIKNEDVLTFNLKEGDIIDIAFYKNNPNYTVRVLYKHETDYSSLENINSKNTTSNQSDKKKNKTTKQFLDRNSIFNKSLFRDRKVLIVGGVNRKADYRNTFEKLGAEFELASGDEPKDTLASMISKSEVVGIAVGKCSHDASIFTVDTCKKLGIPFSSTHQAGLQSMVLCVEEAMMKGIKDELLTVDSEAI